MAIPLDSVIAACAEARGITTVYGDVEDVRERMGTKRFDCILISNVLHLMRDPLGVLRACTEALSNDGSIVFSAPNFDYLKAIWRGLAGKAGYTKLRSYDDSRLHRTAPRVIRHWLANCDLRPEKVLHVFPKRAELPAKLAPGLLSPFLAKELIIRARKKPGAYCPTVASMNPDVRLAEESQLFV